MNYENLDLSKDDDLKKACKAVRENRPDWKAEIVAFLQDVQNTDEETRNGLEFQKKLWNLNPISKSKRGNINVDSVIGEEEFRKWFVERLKEPTLSRESTKERADVLEKLLDDVTNRVKNYEITKTPHLKIARALAAFYPRWGERNLGDAEAEARKVLAELMDALRPERLHFGWRTVDDVLDFLEVALGESHGMEVAAALDGVIYAKVLPKLRGDDRPELRDALTKCRDVLSTHGLTRCRDRVNELVKDLASTGSVRFWR